MDSLDGGSAIVGMLGIVVSTVLLDDLVDRPLENVASEPEEEDEEEGIGRTGLARSPTSSATSAASCMRFSRSVIAFCRAATPMLSCGSGWLAVTAEARRFWSDAGVDHPPGIREPSSHGSFLDEERCGRREEFLVRVAPGMVRARRLMSGLKEVLGGSRKVWM